MTDYSEDEIRALVASVPYWRHAIELPYGITTPGRLGPELIRSLLMPSSLHGKTVLDIGAFDGLCAFAAEQRGAARVVAMDVWSGEGSDDPAWWSQVHTGGRGFRIAHKILGSTVEPRELSVYDLDPAIETFDIVLMCGLLYHLRDPFLGLKNALSVTREFLLVESAFARLGDDGVPTALFCKQSEANRHPSNWWQLSQDAIAHMCWAAGARRVEVRSTMWHCSGKRFLASAASVPVFARPRADAAQVGELEPSPQLEVASRHTTYRDGYYWVRVGGQDGSLRYARFDEDPPINLEDSSEQAREGRIVFTVCP